MSVSNAVVQKAIEVASSEKCTKSVVNRLREYARETYANDLASFEMHYFMDVASFIELQNRKKAARRPSVSWCAHRMNKQAEIIAELGGVLEVEYVPAI